jgi:3-methyladenine DNA glycosylase/8-oxoguanine DNA glycosylase
LDWEKMLGFFKKRAVVGVEMVEGLLYRRTVRIGGCHGRIAIWPSDKKYTLNLEMDLSDNSRLMEVVSRVRRMFDLDTDMSAIHECLILDDLLKKVIEKHGGMRLPGAWDPFEVVARAVVGQQISVKGAGTILGRIVQRAGMPACNLSLKGLDFYFPDAREILDADLKGLGMPEKRCHTLGKVAEAVLSGQLRLEIGKRSDGFINEILKIKGVGPWTANYIAMRALGNPDAFIAQDLGIIKALTPKSGVAPTIAQVEKRAENWRPWRAYAAIYLWQML